MKLLSGHAGREPQIIDLFRSTFAASEGADEGRLIGDLVTEILESQLPEEVGVFSALENEQLVGCIIFTPLTYSQDPRSVRLLSPVAVRTDHHNAGVGQKLIRFGLETLQQRRVDVVVTYGDPRFYSKVGFAQITEQVAKAPLELQHPQGWLAQSLTAKTVEPLIGPCECIEAFDKPALW
ncbi:MAG: N-acetyltransferase [Rhizobiaceae bacterium]